jgi:hypothetical protein
MFKKYITFLGSNGGSSGGSLASAEPYPSDIWSAPQAFAAYARNEAPSLRQPQDDVQDSAPPPEPNVTDLTQAKLHARVIALENLMIAFLSTATEQQLDCACDMAVNISPRNGATQHSLTKTAAAEMLSIVARAIQVREIQK